MRATAHRIADFVYEKLTGEKGVFSTRIAYVVKRGTRYELQIADADGAARGDRARLLRADHLAGLVARRPAPRLRLVRERRSRWSTCTRCSTASASVVANFRGSNSAPAWSPDGKTLAVALSRDGGSQIFLVNPDGSGARRRITNSSAIDTEPRFSPDGKWIYFTSDRGGSPQIYRMPATGGEPQRVTFEGSYNVSPRLSPDGKSSPTSRATAASSRWRCWTSRTGRCRSSPTATATNRRASPPTAA